MAHKSVGTVHTLRLSSAFHLLALVNKLHERIIYTEHILSNENKFYLQSAVHLLVNKRHEGIHAAPLSRIPFHLHLLL